jgi:hypothetical protein
MLKSDVLNLNGANNAASRLCELAAQHYYSLRPFQGGRSEPTRRRTQKKSFLTYGENIFWHLGFLTQRAIVIIIFAFGFILVLDVFYYSVLLVTLQCWVGYLTVLGWLPYNVVFNVLIMSGWSPYSVGLDSSHFKNCEYTEMK